MVHLIDKIDSRVAIPQTVSTIIYFRFSVGFWKAPSNTVTGDIARLSCTGRIANFRSLHW